MYRGELPTGKDRQAALDGDPYAQGYGSSTTLVETTNGPVWIGMTEQKMGRRFTVIDNFKSEETQSEYVAGLSYEGHEGDKVTGLIDKWIKEGKVREGGPISEVSGGDSDPE